MFITRGWRKLTRNQDKLCTLRPTVSFLLGIGHTVCEPIDNVVFFASVAAQYSQYRNTADGLYMARKMEVNY